MAKKNQNDTDSLGLDPKWKTKLPDGWMDGAEAMNTEELKKKLLECENTIVSTEKDMESDTRLAAAKEDAKLLSSGYKEVLTEQKAMIKTVVFILNSRGAV